MKLLLLVICVTQLPNYLHKYKEALHIDDHIGCSRSSIKYNEMNVFMAPEAKTEDESFDLK